MHAHAQKKTLLTHMHEINSQITHTVAYTHTDTDTDTDTTQTRKDKNTFDTHA